MSVRPDGWRRESDLSEPSRLVRCRRDPTLHAIAAERRREQVPTSDSWAHSRLRLEPDPSNLVSLF